PPSAPWATAPYATSPRTAQPPATSLSRAASSKSSATASPCSPTALNKARRLAQWTGWLRPRPVAFPQQAQAGQGELLVGVVNVTRVRRQQRGQAAGGDHGRRSPEFPLQPFQQAVHQRDVAPEQTRLQAPHGGCADQFLRRLDLDPLQARRAREQRIGGDPQPRANKTAAVLARGGDHIERRGGAEVH